MRHNFISRRRVVGVATLLVSCLTLAVWVRSAAVCDQIEFPCLGRQVLVVSIYGNFWVASADGQKPHYQWLQPYSPMTDSSRHWDKIRMKWGETWCIPYWAVFLVFFLPSGYLLLSKVRTAKSGVIPSR